jgi:hypothetical protein
MLLALYQVVSLLSEALLWPSQHATPGSSSSSNISNSSSNSSNGSSSGSCQMKALASPDPQLPTRHVYTQVKSISASPPPLLFCLLRHEEVHESVQFRHWSHQPRNSQEISQLGYGAHVPTHTNLKFADSPHGEVHECVQCRHCHGYNAQPKEALGGAQARIREEDGLVEGGACSSSSSKASFEIRV